MVRKMLFPIKFFTLLLLYGIFLGGLAVLLTVCAISGSDKNSRFAEE